MFNGIIFNKGSISKILKRPKGINIFIKSDLKLSMRDIGVSEYNSVKHLNFYKLLSYQCLI